MMYQTNTTGFTFVETLVAITILLIALVVPLTIVTDATRGNTTANQQVVAFFLAQEGLELAQQLRDQGSLNYIDGGGTDSKWIINHADNINGTNYDGGSGNPDCIESWCGLTRHQHGLGAFTHLRAVPQARGVACNGPGFQCRIFKNTKDGRTVYTHQISAPSVVRTPYTRRIRIDDEGVGEAKITAEVTWRSGFLLQEQRVQISTTVFNFYEQ